MSGVLRWEDPPEPDCRGTRNKPAIADWPLVLAQLRGRPRVWALVSKQAPSAIATAIREGKMLDSGPPGSFTAKCVRVNGVLCLYAKFIGETPP